MTFEALETSVHDGAPVELYEFSRGSESWRLASADEDVVHDGQTYQAVPMSRSEIEQSQEQARNTLTLRMPRDATIAAAWSGGRLGAPMLLTVRGRHRGDPEAVVGWLGRVLAVEWQGSEAIMTCEPVWVSLRRIGLRRLYSRGCPHTVYGGECGVVEADHQVAGLVMAVSAAGIQVGEAAAYADQYFAGGVITWTDAGGRVQRRMIAQQVGALLHVWSPSGLAPGMAVTLAPGCPQDLDTCAGRFGNAPNYGGFPFMSCKNPFTTTVF